MKISDLQDKQGHINLDLKIIWDKSPVDEKFGKKIKSVIVADAESKKGDPTAYLDLYNKYIDLYKFGDKIRVIDAYSKLIQNKSGQFRIVNASRIEKLKNEK